MSYPVGQCFDCALLYFDNLGSSLGWRGQKEMTRSKADRLRKILPVFLVITQTFVSTDLDSAGELAIDPARRPHIFCDLSAKRSGRKTVGPQGSDPRCLRLHLELEDRELSINYVAGNLLSPGFVSSRCIGDESQHDCTWFELFISCFSSIGAHRIP
jgi:hypothetical protein